MKQFIFSLLIVLLFPVGLSYSNERNISEGTESCLECHRVINPGIVAGWENSRMSRVTPNTAFETEPLKRRVSFDTAPERIGAVVVGCAECHTLNPEDHKDTFEHNGHKVHTVVTPKDCAICHPREVVQYEQNLMSQAYGNLYNNPLYKSLADSINGIQEFHGEGIKFNLPDRDTEEDSCLYCHGTKVVVKDKAVRETDFGEMEFPVFAGWPNHGVGRINPDETKGSCTPCHSRHGFRLELARKPETCSECHKGPDVPAYKVYSVSKHGNIHSALGKEWNFNAVPWTVGKDFSAPTCAACHVSLLVSDEGAIIAERSHRMNNRIPWRIFGLIYAHAHPKSPDTTLIKNRGGLALPTDFSGEPATAYLIDENELKNRLETMKGVCLSCHSQGLVVGHFVRLENTIITSNRMTQASTSILLSAWNRGLAKGPAQKDSPFNEAIEKMWIEQWLFFANSTRFASAMGGADYGVFDNGRWYLSRNIRLMEEWLRSRTDGKK